MLLKNVKKWSERWELNPRQSRWQREALPLSYARLKSGIEDNIKNFNVKLHSKKKWFFQI